MTSSFEQLSTDTLAKIKGFGIKRSVFNTLRQSCRMLKAYLEENNFAFSFENGQKWLATVRPCEPSTHSQRTLYSGRRRAVFLLSDCQNNRLDFWQIYPQKTAVRPETLKYLQLLRLHEENLRAIGMAKGTIKLAMCVNSSFLIYLEKSGKFEINCITQHDVTGYFTQDVFLGRKPKGVRLYAHNLKSFLGFLEDTGVVPEKKLSLSVPKVFGKQESIVTVLSKKAVKALRNKGRESNVGIDSRNHAIVLLALRLGIRCSDIFKMELTEIDWKNDKISFVQQKTKVPITLPLPPDVGNALMDYILNFRPQGAGNTVFVRHYAPYQALSPSRKVLAKYLSVFDAEDCPQRGFHVLRRTFATGMLQNNITRSVISASLGQTNPNSVDVYLSTDEQKMRKCSLSLKGIECGKGDLR